jgi:hypothetical protein
MVTVCADFGSRLWTLAPWAWKAASFPSYCLLVRGVWFHILTSTNLPAEVCEFCCVTSAKKVLFVKDCGKEILQAGSHIMATASVSPKLSS